jgi:Ca2+/Na+ antiporter
MDFDDLGFAFYAKLAGVFLLGAIVLIFIFIFFTRAVYAWGLFGAFLFLAAAALLAGWIFDRHEKKERQEAGGV